MDLKANKLPPKEERPLLSEAEKQKIEFAFYRKKRLKKWYLMYMATTATALFLCIAVLVAQMGRGSWLTQGAVSRIASFFTNLDFMNLMGRGDNSDEVWEETVLPDVFDGFLLPDHSISGGNGSNTEPPSSPTVQTPPLTFENLYQFDYSRVPNGEIPIIPMDLSLISYGTSYIHNSTGLSPDTNALLNSALKKNDMTEYLAVDNSPLVLIVHTHGTESYSANGAISYVDDESELARSTDVEENVVAVGKRVAEVLNNAGISTLHCTIMHDQIQYKDSYSRAEATIREYLEKYPSIRLVIDLHRDSIVKSTGELVRPVTLIDGKPTAQVMCVVGSDWGGEENPNWEGNLALALKLREALNSKYNSLCRPPYLRPSTYNQELAPYSLLLEMGASGNSLEEALRSADAIGETLIKLISQL